MSDLILGTLLGLISSALFALQNVLIRGQRQGISPLIANSIKMWISGLLMMALVVLPWRVHEFLLPQSALFPLAASVLLGGAFGDALYLISQERIGVSRAFPILNTYPVITYVLALLFLGDVVDIGIIAGITLTICGVVLVSREISVEGVGDKFPRFDQMGFALAVLSSITFAFATVFMELGVTDIDPIDANMFRMLVGSMIMVPIFSVSARNRTRLLSRKAVKVVAIAGFFGMGLSSLLYLASIKLVGATIGAVLGSTAPLFALPFSILHLKERITWKGIVGTFATIIGIWLVVIGV